ncbi:TonB-dependent receptor-like protein [Sphingobium sp. SYK-6]|uniref:TonB-dependent receptor plug domain-containing protein n=1 Tax=Sphingobium sp. (strain NBRC 103272 / SYK-6) TaxID=627192 RepID=UPI000227754D|nr:TonB-dependent receptor [Sphingobium sp. SYK-6]BAK66097.1 TonB-dependent receptor-like protein [Sphingobium sp. SYK-6]
MYRLLICASASALMATIPFQTAGAQGIDAEEGGSDAIVITGSRIARDGYNAPTPLTVLNEADVQVAAPANVADFVNQIPSLVGSATPANSNLSISAGTAGVNALNLRALGSSRTLVLLDGQRSVGATLGGIVDVNNIPQGLVKSVEVVTGGASAAYGSDAVSGVVNFILDKEFTGIKGAIEGGETTYGDGQNYRISLSGGMSFAGGRGHLLLNGEYAKKEGIHGVPRDWNQQGWYMINNPAYAAGNGAPERLIVRNAGLSNAYPGGMITNTALRGTTFGVNGALGQFAYGETRDPWMIGGDWQAVQVNSNQSLDPEEERKGLFGRLSYEVTDNIELFGQVSWNQTKNLGWLGVQMNQGNVTIQRDNAFIPEELRERMVAEGIQSFALGTTNADLPIRKNDGVRETERYVVGANGHFELLGTTMRWDAYYQKGITRTREMARDITNNARLAAATDAVFHPDTGEIVCRSSIANPGNGCVPLNRLGIGVADPAALDYVLGNPFRRQKFEQDVFAANLSFNAFDLPAGAVAIAVGAEHRKEKVSGEVDPDFQSGWFVGNFRATNGQYDVTEAYLELLVPIAEGLEFNGAVRGTDYSTSGYVTTWKAGLTYEPIPDIRLRATRSRDIRAPNLGELFTAGSTRTNVLIDPFNGNATVQFSGTTQGNLGLDPEKADQWGIGAVFEPTFLRGFAMSVDFYDIKLNGGISSATAQTIVDRCFEGVQQYCAAIVRGPNAFGTNLQVFESPFNFATQHAQGLDFEASYRTPLDRLASSLGGDLLVRAMATRYLKNYVDDGLTTPTDSVGQNAGSGPPKWLYRVQATYTNDPVSITLIGRGVSAGVYDNSFITCTSGCPVSTADNRTINSNRIDGAFYVDANITYDFSVLGEESQLFFNVRNLFNKDPAIVAGGGQGAAGSAYATPSTNQSLYDLLGRTFRVGLRFKF